MNRLFTKIFLGFWLTTIAVVIATAFATYQLNQGADDDSVAAHFERSQAAYAAAAQAILNVHGRDALIDWMRQLRGPGGARARLQLFDDNGLALFGPPPSAEIKNALAAFRTEPNATDAAESIRIEALDGARGERYWFVSDRRRPAQLKHKGRRFLRMGPPGRGLGGYRLAIAFLVSGLVCFWLARYLTQPIRRLQAASAEIASGNLSVRVADSKRRDELGDLGRDFDQMAEHLEHLQASQHQLLRDVSHELRSPIARLQIALGLARQRGDGSITNELDRIEREAEALEALIAQILSVERIEAATVDLTAEPIEIGALIDPIIRDANFEGSDAGKQVQRLGDSDCRIAGDAAMLASAFENIIRNALRYAPPNSLIDVTVVRAAGGKSVSIAIRDRGPGVDIERIDDLFKPFVRAEYARDRDSGGFGIGLAITSAAVRRHNGSIAAENHPQGGFTVTVVLPTV